MSFARLRLAGGFALSLAMALGAAAAVVGRTGPTAHLAAGLLCTAMPLAVLLGWRLTQRAPRGASLGPPSGADLALHLGAWLGIATGSGIWLLTAVALETPSRAGLWVLGPLGLAVGAMMTGVVCWSFKHPFPAIVADDEGLRIGDAHALPWRDIASVAYRRPVSDFPHVEIRLRTGETLRPKAPVTLATEEVDRFLAVANERLTAGAAA